MVVDLCVLWEQMRHEYAFGRSVSETILVWSEILQIEIWRVSVLSARLIVCCCFRFVDTDLDLCYARYTRTFWLPDSFGYSSQLPQLCRLAGMDFFFT